MRLATIRIPGGTRAALVEGTDVFELAETDVRAVLESGPDWPQRVVKQRANPKPWSSVSFAPIVSRPEKVFILAWNYKSHMAETSAATGVSEMPQYPSMFAKFTRSLVGAYDPVAMPDFSDQVDPEVELCIVIGRTVRKATEAQASAAIGGFTVLNDMSVRDWQFRTPFPLQGKANEHMTPVGPVMVTPDEVDDAKDLRVECLIDAFSMQDSRTSNMIFSPAYAVAYISTFITLDPGDLISLGTPAGVGFTRNPQKFLKVGERLTTRIEGIGELVNLCVPEAEWSPATGAPRAMETALQRSSAGGR